MESNRGVFKKVLEQLLESTECVREVSEERLYLVGLSWDSYWIDNYGGGITVHAFDRVAQMCGGCREGHEQLSFNEDDDYDSSGIMDGPTFIDDDDDTGIEYWVTSPPSLASALGYRSTASRYQEEYGFRTAHYPSFDVPYTFSDHVFVKDEENGGLALIPKREAFRRAMGRSLDDSSEGTEEEEEQEESTQEKPPPAASLGEE